MKLVKKAKWMLLGGAVSVIISGITGNIIFLDNQKEKLNHLALTVLGHSENVSSQIANSITETKSLGINACTDQNLDQIREIIWKYASVEDIGIVNNNQIICTAHWGILKKPLALADLDFTVTKYNYHLYSSKKGILPYGMEMDMTIKDNIVAFTSPFAFREVFTENNSSEFFLASKENNHIFFSHNNSSPNVLELDKKKINVSQCSKIYEYCAIASERKKGILSLATIPLIIYFVWFFILGWMIAYAILSFMANSRSMEFRLKKAILQKKLYLEYQPLVCAKTQTTIGVEALIRWNDKVFGQVSPDLFISISEKIGIYNNISAFVCNQAIDDMAVILKEHKGFFLSINIGKTEINDPLFLDNLVAKANVYQIPLEQIKIEITERSNDSYKNIADFSNNAKDKGFKVSLDDFGTGVSNLIWLTEIHFDEIKLDKFFVSGLKNKFKKEILMSVLNTLSGLNKRIVFEGVETQEDFEFVKTYNDNALIQGWYFYKSLSIDKLGEALLLEEKKDETSHSLTEDQEAAVVS